MKLSHRPHYHYIRPSLNDLKPGVILRRRLDEGYYDQSEVLAVIEADPDVEDDETYIVHRPSSRPDVLGYSDLIHAGWMVEILLKVRYEEIPIGGTYSLTSFIKEVFTKQDKGGEFNTWRGLDGTLIVPEWVYPVDVLLVQEEMMVLADGIWK